MENQSAEEVAANPHLMRQVEDVPGALSDISAPVDYFVSEDKDFTDDKNPTTEEIRKHMNIMRPVIFLRDMMGWSHEELERVHLRDGPLNELAE